MATDKNNASNNFGTQKGTGMKSYNYNESDNLFSGVWDLNQNNLDRFDPFITGYSFIVWTKLPAFFEKSDITGLSDRFKGITEKNFKTFSGLGDMSLSVEDMTHGFTGNAYGVATNIQKENTSFTISHYESAGSPIRQLYTYWVTGIRDFETGLGNYHGLVDKLEGGYSAKNHTGELLYILTDPSGGWNGTGIEFACYYTNVMPTKIPMDHLNYTSGDHSVPELSIDFRGNYHQSDAINELAAKFLKENHIKKGYSSYDPKIDNISKRNYDPSSFDNN